MEGPVAPHSIYPRHGVRALILFSSFHLAGNLHFLPPRTPTVCLSRFLLKSRWWLYSPGPHPTPPRRSNLSHPPSSGPPFEFYSHLLPANPRLTHRFSFSSFVPRRLPRTRSHLIFRYTETILYLRRDYASLADNRKYAIE